MRGFDRQRLDAYLVRLRTAMEADAAAARDDQGAVADELGLRINGSQWRKVADSATADMREVIELFEGCLDEIERQACEVSDT